MDGRLVLKVNRRYCPHCKEQLSLKTFKTHKRRYYDSLTEKWHSSYGLNTSESASTKETSLTQSSDESTLCCDDSPPLTFGDNCYSESDDYYNKGSVSPPCVPDLDPQCNSLSTCKSSGMFGHMHYVLR